MITYMWNGDDVLRVLRSMSSSSFFIKMNNIVNERCKGSWCWDDASTENHNFNIIITLPSENELTLFLLSI